MREKLRKRILTRKNSSSLSSESIASEKNVKLDTGTETEKEKKRKRNILASKDTSGSDLGVSL